jgi:uncharacterized protein involved in copper resistance
MCRTILVALLAVAIGLLPASMGIVSAAPAANGIIVASATAMPDCDHHHHDKAPGKETQKTAHHGACVVGCALCFGFVDAVATSVAYRIPSSAALQVPRVRIGLSSLMGSPPFRPPRA